MKIAVALLTCDRPGYTKRTLQSFFRHNAEMASRFYYADDASRDPQVRRIAENHGFEPVYLNDGPPRRGCSPVSDMLLRETLKRTGPEWLVLYLQNDFESVAPIPVDVVESFFSDPNKATLRLWYNRRFWRRQRENGWPIEHYAGHKVIARTTGAWQVQIARLGWLAEMARGARSEKHLQRRIRARQKQWQIGTLADKVMLHIGRKRTPMGVYKNKQGMPT